MDKELDPVGSVAAALLDIGKRSVEFLYLCFSGALIATLSCYFSRKPSAGLPSDTDLEEIVIPNLVSSISSPAIILALAGSLLSVFSLLKVLRDQSNTFISLCGITGTALVATSAFSQLAFTITPTTYFYLTVGIICSVLFLNLNKKLQLKAWEKELAEIHAENEIRRKALQKEEKDT